MDLSSPQVLRLCHTQSSPQTYLSTGNSIVVRFVSDDSNTGKGFNATYQAIDGGSNILSYWLILFYYHYYMRGWAKQVFFSFCLCVCWSVCVWLPAQKNKKVLTRNCIFVRICIMVEPSSCQILWYLTLTFDLWHWELKLMAARSYFFSKYRVGWQQRVTSSSAIAERPRCRVGEFWTKVEDWNCETIFCRRYRSTFNHCESVT